MNNVKHLDEKMQRLENIIEASGIGTWEWEVQTGKTIFNERWAAIIGYTLYDLSPLSIDCWRQQAHPTDLKKSNEMLKRVFSKEFSWYEMEVRMKHKSGHWVWVIDRGQVVSWSDDGKPLLMAGSHTDITKLKQLSRNLENSLKEVRKSEKVVKFLHRKDALTGLINRRRIEEILETLQEEINRSITSFSIAMIDLDNFKQVNDNYGHLEGDIILKIFSNICIKRCRKVDVIGRFGGDEFILISKETSLENQAKLLINIKNIFESHPIVKKYKVTFSWGNTYVNHNQSVIEKLKEADMIMLKRKSEKK